MVRISIPRCRVDNLVVGFRLNRVVVGVEQRLLQVLHARENDKQFDESLGRLDMEHGFFATGARALGPFWCKAERAVTTRHEDLRKQAFKKWKQ